MPGSSQVVTGGHRSPAGRGGTAQRLRVARRLARGLISGLIRQRSAMFAVYQRGPVTSVTYRLNLLRTNIHRLGKRWWQRLASSNLASSAQPDLALEKSAQLKQPSASRSSLTRGHTGHRYLCARRSSRRIPWGGRCVRRDRALRAARGQHDHRLVASTNSVTVPTYPPTPLPTSMALTISRITDTTR